ncbi:maleylpyruvate isomerase N-terminal domain-containing protein [Micromonospora sp. NPDC000089]|uniref:maleylpyruvate isomerase N-terminal domain-containing protein n=1 Tax=unclassified Micromonospora TaxID=2617518 RepID=UPI00368F73F7
MDRVRAAFRHECARLERILGALTDADLDLPTPCPPWLVRDLVAHVSTGAGRLAGMFAAPAPPRAEVDAAGYFGPAKFAPEVDAARVTAAQAEAARLAAPRVHEAARLAAARAAFGDAWRATDAAVGAYPVGRLVRTRHGEAMTAADFLVTRVVEVGVHGLDLAAAVGRQPWLTPAAAAVIGDLITGGAPAPDALGWDPLTLVLKTTGRAPLDQAERAVVATAGFRRLSFAG